MLQRTPYLRIAAAADPAREALQATQEAIDQGATGINLGWAHKALIEHAYETVRRQVDRRLPSRLRCIFAFTTLDEAVEFAGEQHQPVVYRFAARRSANVAIRDMDLYMPPAEIDVDIDGFRRRWTDACGWAERYWTLPATCHHPEALIDGLVRVLGVAWHASP